MLTPQKREKDGTYGQKNNHWGIKLFLVLVVLAISFGVWTSTDWAISFYRGAEKISYQAVKEVKVDLNIPDTKEKVETRLATLKFDLLKKIRSYEFPIKSNPGDLKYVNDPRDSEMGECARRGGQRSLKCDSWGDYQFKVPTVQYFHQKLYGKTVSQTEAMLIALDNTKAEALLMDVVIKIPGSFPDNWTNTYKKDAQYFDHTITLIREYEELLK